VFLPTVPAMTTSKVYRKDGKERLERRLTTSLDGLVYSIEIFENPKPRQSLEAFIAESSATFRRDSAIERTLTVDGFPGKEYSSHDKTSVVQFLATGDRLFRFAVSGSSVAAPVVREFFATIRLGKKADGFEVSEGPGTPLEYNGERLFAGKEVDVKARLLARPEPTYTEDARKKHISGTVVLRAIFSKTGNVENIYIVSGLPHGLTEQAINAARRIRFTPATKDGKYVSMWMQLEYNFVLK
jgi:TonB family protein